MCQVEEHKILSFVGRNDLNQLENVGTSNIFISILFDPFMRIDRINPTNKLTASTHPCSYNPMGAYSYNSNILSPPCHHICPPPFGFDHKHCRAIVRITGTARQLIAFGFRSAPSSQTKTIVSPSPR